jgi:mono/diheme cytochrome c family protein
MRTTKATYMKRIILLAAVFGLTAATTAFADDAKDLWTANCAKCHGADGKGQTKIGQKLGIKDFTDPKVQAGLKDDAAASAIKNGLKSDDGRTLMKPYDALTDDQIKGLVAYIHTLK